MKTKLCKPILIPSNKGLIVINTNIEPNGKGDIILIDTEEEIVEGDSYHIDNSVLHETPDKIKTACIEETNEPWIKPYSKYCSKIIASSNKSHNLPQLSPQSIQLLINYYNKYKCMPENIKVKIHEYINFQEGDKVMVGKDVYGFKKGSKITIIGFNHNSDSNLVSFKEDDEYNQGFHIKNLEHKITESIEDQQGEVDITIPEVEEKLYTEEEVKTLCIKTLELSFDLAANPLPRLNKVSGKQYWEKWFNSIKKK